MDAEQTARLIRDAADLLARSDFEREVIEVAMRSVFSAMERVRPDDRAELQGLVDASISDPDDKDIVARLGTLLRHAPRPDH